MHDPNAFRYESPIEQRLARELFPQLHDGVTVETQKTLTGLGQTFRADFYLTCRDRVVVIEADGRDFHEYWSDQKRDAVMLVACGVTDILRFRGCDIYFEVESCVTAVSWFMRFLLDPAAVPYDLADKVLQSRMLRGAVHKPIYRCRAGLGETYDQLSSDAKCDTYTCLGRVEDSPDAVAQFKSPYWDRKYEGIKIWQISDYLRTHPQAAADWLGEPPHAPN